jgi:hypothetical protein
VDDQERIIEQKDVRLYRTSVTLLEPNVSIRFDGAKIEYVNPLPVHDDTGRVIGGASIAHDGQKVTAEIVFDYATPERLDLENDAVLFAEPRGYMWPAQKPLSFEQFPVPDNQPYHAGRVVLTGVVLSRSPGSRFHSRVVGRSV